MTGLQNVGIAAYRPIAYTPQLLETVDDMAESLDDLNNRRRQRRRTVKKQWSTAHPAQAHAVKLHWRYRHPERAAEYDKCRKASEPLSPTP